MAALDKIFELLDEEPDLRRRARTRSSCRALRGEIALRGRHLRLRRADAERGAATTSTCTCRRARPSRWSARPAPASRRSPSSSRASTTRPRGACSSTATTCATCTAPLAALADGDRAAGGVPVQRHDRREHRLRPAGRDAARRSSRGRARGRRRTTSSPRSSTATTPQVGERGVQLSAGQRQLVAFARALIADPRILVLDEATSNVDIHTEGRIEDGLRRLLAGRTAIVIAHRLSTIRARGPDRRARPRPDRRAGHARRAARGGGRLLAPVPRLGRAGRHRGVARRRRTASYLSARGSSHACAASAARRARPVARAHLAVTGAEAPRALRGRDSNPNYQSQNLACCQLHHPARSGGQYSSGSSPAHRARPARARRQRPGDAAPRPPETPPRHATSRHATSHSRRKFH